MPPGTIDRLVYGSVIVALFVGFLVLCSTPGKIARRRGHPEAAVINVCGWLGVVFFPMLFVAFKWARSEIREKREEPPRDDGRALGFPVTPIPVKSIAPTPGRFKISGVIKSTGADVKTYIEAASCENALVKAELKGIVVTSIEEA